jgi:hypothetical protein
MKLTMMQSLVVLSAGLAGIAFALSSTRAIQAEQKPSRAQFMRQKLVFAKDVLEGLALERFDTIEQGGKALRRLSGAAEWEVPTIPNATDYIMMTTDFQRHADDLVKQAKAKNIDAATLAYVKLTMSCVQCHKFIRDTGK